MTDHTQVVVEAAQKLQEAWRGLSSDESVKVQLFTPNHFQDRILDVCWAIDALEGHGSCCTLQHKVSLMERHGYIEDRFCPSCQKNRSTIGNECIDCGADT